MVSRRRTESEPQSSPRKRATTPEGRENQLVALAIDAAEKQLKAGTASAQVITHFLKLGSTREQLEQQRLAGENELLRAKVDALASASRIEELIGNALSAFRSYSGQDPEQESEDDAD